MGRKSFAGGAWVDLGVENKASEQDGSRTITSDIHFTLQWTRKIKDLNTSSWYVPKILSQEDAE